MFFLCVKFVGFLLPVRVYVRFRVAVAADVVIVIVVV